MGSQTRKICASHRPTDRLKVLFIEPVRALSVSCSPTTTTTTTATATAAATTSRLNTQITLTSFKRFIAILLVVIVFRATVSKRAPTLAWAWKRKHDVISNKLVGFQHDAAASLARGAHSLSGFVASCARRRRRLKFFFVSSPRLREASQEVVPLSVSVSVSVAFEHPLVLGAQWQCGSQGICAHYLQMAHMCIEKATHEPIPRQAAHSPKPLAGSPRLTKHSSLKFTAGPAAQASLRTLAEPGRSRLETAASPARLEAGAQATTAAALRQWWPTSWRGSASS